MPLSDLPTELVLEILAFALAQHHTPSSILCVNKKFLSVGEPILYANLYFHSTLGLSQFSQQRNRPQLVCRPPRTLVIALPGGAADFYVFKYLRDVLRRCCTWNLNDNADQVSLDVLSLCLHSHSRNPNLELIYDGLSLANPRDFTWCGPDPSHHFSTAIVPAATVYLLRAISHWSNLRNLKLTNVSFPSDGLGVHASFSKNAPLLPAIPTLRTMYLGQVTLLPPSAIASMVLLPGMEGFERVRLVDAYKESIWGPRIRRRDVETCALAIAASGNNLLRLGAELDAKSVIARVRHVVRCEARTERIMGGDRIEEGITILE